MQLTRSPRMSEIKDEDFEPIEKDGKLNACLLYTSDAADD